MPLRSLWGWTSYTPPRPTNSPQNLKAASRATCVFYTKIYRMFWLSIAAWSRIFHPCSLVPIIPVSHFQSPPPLHLRASCFKCHPVYFIILPVKWPNVQLFNNRSYSEVVGIGLIDHKYKRCLVNRSLNRNTAWGIKRNLTNNENNVSYDILYVNMQKNGIKLSRYNHWF